MSIFVNQEYRDRRSAGLRNARIEDRVGAHLEDVSRGFTPPPVHVRLEKLGQSRWLVHDAEGNRGGLFRDYASAMQFVRREFSTLQPPVVEMLLPELDCQTTHSSSDHLMATRTTNSGASESVDAANPIERNIADQAVAAVDVPSPGEQETNWLANGHVATQIQPATLADAFDLHAAVQPPQDDGEPQAREEPERTTTQSVEPSFVSKTEKQSDLLADQRASHQCIESLTGALAVHLGPISKVIVDQSLKDASSVEHLIALMERYIPNDEKRILFHARASHICATFAGDPI